MDQKKRCPGIFEDIYSGKREGRVAYRNKTHGIAVIMDAKPVGEGHLLTFPLACVDSMDDLPPSLRDKVYTVSTYAGQVLKRIFGSEYGYVGQLVAGNQVPHAHVHRVPGDDNANWMKRFGKVEGFGRLEGDQLPSMDEIFRELVSPSMEDLWQACDQEVDAKGIPDPLTMNAIRELDLRFTQARLPL